MCWGGYSIFVPLFRNCLSRAGILPSHLYTPLGPHLQQGLTACRGYFQGQELTRMSPGFTAHLGLQNPQEGAHFEQVAWVAPVRGLLIGC